MKNSQNNSQSHLLVQLAEETYAINVSKVYQIFEVPPITKVPQTPPYMLGVMNARGRLLPVIDLRILYGMETSAHSKHTAIIATACNFWNEDGEQLQDVGLLVDAVHEVTDIDSSTIERPALPGNSEGYSCFAGFVRLGENIVLVLDIDNLLNSEGIAQLKSFIAENTPA
ncbi:MAG TPA: chemotaxis protein CheW [Bacteroidales bacterium]